MKHVLRSIVTLLSLFFPIAVAAVAPGPVTGLQGVYQQGNIQLSWTAPQGATDIAYYRVYYSRASILENNGEYDDFEATPTKATTFSLAALPEASTMFIGVLAVNTNGEEGGFFTEEISVDLPGGMAVSSIVSSASATSSASPLSSVATASSATTEAQRLLSAQSISASGVLLTFALPVVIDPDEAVSAFQVSDGSGSSLTLRRLVIMGTQVIIVTSPQEKDRIYMVRVSRVVTGKSATPSAAPVELDFSASFGMFTGHPDGMTGPVPTENGGAADVSNMKLQVEKQTDGTYSVLVRWNAPAAGDTVTFQLQQSRDKGLTFGTMQSVLSTVTSVRFTGVAQGNFGVVVRAVGPDGIPSRGVFTTTVVGDPGKAPATPVQPTPSKPLTDSGTGNLLVLLLTGTVMGWVGMRQYVMKSV